MERFIHILFEADHNEITWWAMIIRALMIYILALVFFKIGGKRMFSNYGSFDIVVSMVLGALLAKAIVGNAKFIPTVITALVLVLAHRFIAILAKQHNPTGKILKGDVSLLYKEGRFFEEDMKLHGISKEDMLEALRIEGKTKDFSKVDEINLERNGRISVILS